MTQNMDVDDSDNAKTTFTIAGGNADFASKQQTLFQQLEAAEKSIGRNSNDIIEKKVLKRSSRNARSDTRQFRGQESIFKRPEAPISKCLKVRGLPDFRKNPHKWVKYSLADVSARDNSDRGNTAAALSFLQEIESRKVMDTDMNSADMSEPGKVLFKSRKEEEKLKFNKSAALKRIAAEDTEEEKPHFRNNKLIMPEYVVGCKIKKDKKIKPTKNEESHSKKILTLSHLTYEDDEDNN